MNSFIKQKQPHRLGKQTFRYQRGKVGGRDNQEFGINTYTLLHIKQIINRDLMQSAANSTQYSVVTYMGKESEKEWIYVDV